MAPNLKTNPDTIVIKLRGLRKEGPVESDAGIYPGALVDRSGTDGGYTLRPAAANPSLSPMVVTENELFGREITVPYANKAHALYVKDYLNDRVQVEYLNTGAEARMRLGVTGAIARGSFLAPSTTNAGALVLTANGADAIGIALEAHVVVDATTAAAAGGPLILVEFI